MQAISTDLRSDLPFEDTERALSLGWPWEQPECERRKQPSDRHVELTAAPEGRAS
jgi:hypothetical protein